MENETTPQVQPGAKRAFEMCRAHLPESRPRWPHAVVLHLTDAQYQEFKKDPVAFDEKHRVYPEQRIRTVHSYQEMTLPEDDPPGESWTVTLLHGKPSNVGIVACQAHDHDDQEGAGQ